MSTIVLLRMVRCVSFLALFPVGDWLSAQATEFHKIFPVTLAEPVKLTVELACGELEIAYSRDGQVAISAAVQTGDLELDESYFSRSLSVEQSGNKILIRQAEVTGIPAAKIRSRYRIDVPYRTEIKAVDKRGSQTIRGVLGPVEMNGGQGNISVSFVSRTVTVQVEKGDIDLQMIGERVFARSGNGDITAERLAKGIIAGTGEGDITLRVIGASEATVKHGTGRIDIGGARESVVSSTDGGDLHVKAVPRSDWKLSSRSGTIRLEVPPRAGFVLDAATETGRLQLDRDDLPALALDARQIQHKINGGGTKIEARTKSGAILIR